MDEFVVDVSQIEFLARCSYIPLVEPIGFETSVIIRYQNISPNVEFPFFIKQRITYVLLHNKSLLRSILVAGLHVSHQILL